MLDVPKIDIRPDHWEIVQGILKKHVPQHVVWAFGSRAKWVAKAYSDLDLAVITDHPLSLDVSASLSDDFSESDLPYKVDVVDWATTSESFRKVIERDKIVVQEGKKRGEGMSEWRTLMLDEILEITSSKRIFAHEYQKTGVPFWRGKEVTEKLNGSVISTELFITETKFQEIKEKHGVPEEGDILLTSVGTLGSAYQVRTDDRFYFKDGNITWFRNFKINIDSQYLLFWLRSQDTQNTLLSIAIGTTQKALTIKELKRLRISLPPITEQRAIAHILGTLDDKIELNRKQNETLEAMARALFKAWFVDFEPVRAKMEGRWARGQSLPGLPAQLFDLFPDKLVESELGEIPEGWLVGSFADSVEIIGGGTPKTSVSEYWGGEIPWFSVVDTPASSDVFVIQTEKSITQAGLNGSSARLINKGTTIISARGTVGNLAIAGCDMTFNQSCYALRSKNGSGSYFVFLSAQRMVEQLKAMAHGSVFSTITRETFEAVRHVFPPEKLLHQFELSAANLFDVILSNVNNSRTLSQLRDTLLPKLISGELRVPSVMIEGIT